MPLQSAAEGKFTEPIRDVFTLWQIIDAAGVGITLSDTYVLDDFETEFNELKTLFNTLNSAVIKLTLGRDARDKVMAKVRAVLGGYRLGVESAFLPDSPYVTSIPRLSPLPGHTPAPVVLSASYDAVTNEAVYTSTASAEPALREYEVRVVPGPEFDAEDEFVLTSIPAGGTREFRSSYSLDNPGMAVSARVYVILETDNEAGSNTITITRPA